MNTSTEAIKTGSASLSRETLERIAGSVPVGIVLIEPGDKLAYMNRFAQEQIFAGRLTVGDSFPALVALCEEARLLSTIVGTPVPRDCLLARIRPAESPRFYIVQAAAHGDSGELGTLLVLQPAFPLLDPLAGPEETGLLDRMVREVSHHVSNPLAYIAINVELLGMTLASLKVPEEQSDERADCEELVHEVTTGIERITGVVRTLQEAGLGRVTHKECVERLERGSPSR